MEIYLKDGISQRTRFSIVKNDKFDDFQGLEEHVFQW